MSRRMRTALLVGALLGLGVHPAAADEMTCLPPGLAERRYLGGSGS